jgi:hypothetical protein
MPVTDPAMPEPLKTAMETMEREVQSTKGSMAYCAPEMQDEFWIALQHDLAEALRDLYNAVSPEPYEPAEE